MQLTSYFATNIYIYVKTILIIYKKLKYIKVFWLGCILYIYIYIYIFFFKIKINLKVTLSKVLLLVFNLKSNCYLIMDNKEFNIHLVRGAVFDE